MNYKIKAKIDGKYFTFGNVQEGKYGPRLGLRMSPELRKMLEGTVDGQWVNFSLFAEEGKDAAPAVEPISSDVPF
jgi:hypothetical protein